MDRTALVGPEIANGRKIIETLDELGRTVDVGMWAHLPEYDDWRLVVASKKMNQESLRSSYTELLKMLDREGIDFQERSAILLRPMGDPFIQELRRKYHKAVGRTNEGLRIRGEYFGNQLVEDAYVYRIQ
jgi:hypothetical protein